MNPTNAPPVDPVTASRRSASDSSRSRPSRRAFLAAAGTAVASGLSGCSALRPGEEPAPLHDGNWHTYGNGPTNTNRVAGGAPRPADRTLLASTDWPYAPPVVHEGVAYVASDRRVAAVGMDGTERWSRRLDVEVTGTPALDPDRGRLSVPTRTVETPAAGESAAALVTTLSLADGDVRERSRVGTGATYGVTVVDGERYVRSASACVRLAPDGTERWRRSLDPLVYDEYNLGDGTATQVPPAVADDGVYVPDRDALVKLDPATGTERWRVPVDTPYAATTVGAGGVVQTGWQETVGVDAAGDVRWRRDLHSRAAAAVDAGDVYVAAGDLHELDTATGETNWRAHLPGEGTAAPVVTDDTVIAATGNVHAFRREASGVMAPARERWQVSSVHATTYASPVVAAGRVFVASPAGLLALRPGADG